MWKRIEAWFLPVGLTALAILCCLAAELSFPANARPEDEAPPPVLRLHVIANSDSPEDQRVKLAVRDALIGAFAPADSLAEAEEIVLQSGGEIQAAAEAVLAAEGCDYGVQLMLGTFPFPDRSYGNQSYPAGDYEALRVILGEGKGQNWWCVLFPPLCIVEEGSEALPEGEGVVFESAIVNWFKGQGSASDAS